MINKKIILILIFFITVPVFIFAQAKQYTPLTTLPGVFTKDQPVDFKDFIGNIFIFLISAAAVFGFLRLVWEGFQYIFTDSFTTKNDVKGQIWKTLKGLFMVLISYTIIYEINPAALELNLELPRLNIKKSEEVVFAGWSTEPYGDEQKTRDYLASEPKIEINNNGKTCSTGETKGCTNVAGLTGKALSGLKDLKRTCNCSVQITGGTEDGHTTHSVGKGQVDLAPSSDLNMYLWGNANDPENGRSVTKNGVSFTFETTGANGRASGNHWHVSF